MSIETQFKTINDSLFRTDGALDYHEVTAALIILANTVHETETDENIWYIGEGGECCLSDLIPGAYWHFTEWHAGQSSPGYEALSALGRVFKPGMASGPEPESSELEVFKALETMAQE